MDIIHYWASLIKESSGILTEDPDEIDVLDKGTITLPEYQKMIYDVMNDLERLNPELYGIIHDLNEQLFDYRLVNHKSQRKIQTPDDLEEFLNAQAQNDEFTRKFNGAILRSLMRYNNKINVQFGDENDTRKAQILKDSELLGTMVNDRLMKKPINVMITSQADNEFEYMKYKRLSRSSVEPSGLCSVDEDNGYYKITLFDCNDLTIIHELFHAVMFNNRELNSKINRVGHYLEKYKSNFMKHTIFRHDEDDDYDEVMTTGIEGLIADATMFYIKSPLQFLFVCSVIS